MLPVLVPVLLTGCLGINDITPAVQPQEASFDTLPLEATVLPEETEMTTTVTEFTTEPVVNDDPGSAPRIQETDDTEETEEAPVSPSDPMEIVYQLFDAEEETSEVTIPSEETIDNMASVDKSSDAGIDDLSDDLTETDEGGLVDEEPAETAAETEDEETSGGESGSETYEESIEGNKIVIYADKVYIYESESDITDTDTHGYFFAGIVAECTDDPQQNFSSSFAPVGTNIYYPDISDTGVIALTTEDKVILLRSEQ